MRICSKCNLSKDRLEFYVRKNGNLHRECKECYKERIRTYRKNNLEYVRNKEKEYRNVDPKKYRERDRKRNSSIERKNIRKNYTLKNAYNITLNEYYSILEKQGGGCSICGETKSNGKNYLCVDHNHSTGKVRGILCDRCNRGLGLFKDSPELLLNAFDYLKTFGSYS